MHNAPIVLHVSFILFPKFQLLAYVLAIETLRLANKCAGEPVFSWVTRTATNAPVQASSGALIAPDTLDWNDNTKPDMVLLCAGYDPLAQLNPRISAYLARRSTSDCVIGGVDTATTILAELGLLAGYRAVLHYEAEAAFRERWPEIDLSDQIYCLDGQRLTAAGGTATGDAMLAWIERDVSAVLAKSTSEAMVHGGPRSSATPQRDTSTNDPLLMRMHQMMIDHVAEPLTISEICVQLQLSPKQLRLRSNRAYGLTPSEYYRHVRLDIAYNILANSHQNISDVAVACGFNSLSSFSRSFRDRFGRTPTQLRRAP